MVRGSTSSGKRESSSTTGDGVYNSVVLKYVPLYRLSMMSMTDIQQDSKVCPNGRVSRYMRPLRFIWIKGGSPIKDKGHSPCELYCIRVERTIRTGILYLTSEFYYESLVVVGEYGSL